MPSWIHSLAVLLLSFWTAQAMEVQLDQSNENQQRCAGMYSKSTWGGPVDPFISLKFTDVGKDVGDDPVVSLIVFEWRDEGLIGVVTDAATPRKFAICDQAAIGRGFCKDTEIGEWILAPNATQLSNAIIFTKAMHLKTDKPISYPITKTGYYCVLTRDFSATKYEAIVEFRNAYGELPATQIPKLPFFGGITILYALVLVFWGFLYYQHRADILAVQNYITAILIFLVVEMLMTWGFYDYMNRNGSNLGSKGLLVTVAVLNAIRNSFSFFLLLIVCMGYGVVKPTLGRTMVYVRYLAFVHFVFGLIYAVTSLLVTPDTAGPVVLLVVLPLAGTLTAFYVWTLNSLNFTLKDLRERKQHVKEAMYRKLWWSILMSILVIFAFFFFNSFTFASASDPDYVPFHWKSRWFILDGWLNLVYFADVVWIAYIWRPTANNRRFAMSNELAQDDDGTFEIANLDIDAPEDSDFGDEARVGGKGGADTPPSNGSSGTGAGGGGGREYPNPAGAPALKLRNASQPSRNSLDGETIFAVGEDGDRFSDDEDEGLVKTGQK